MYTPATNLPYTAAADLAGVEEFFEQPVAAPARPVPAVTEIPLTERDVEPLRLLLLGNVDAVATDPTHFWVAGPDGSGPYKQNSSGNPFPVWPKGCTRRLPATITKKTLLAHLTTRRSLHVVNDPTAAVWELVVEVDYGHADNRPEPTFVQRMEHHEASAEFAERVAAAAGIPSVHTHESRRAEGGYSRFLFDREGHSPIMARGMIELLAASLEEQFPRREFGPSLDKASPIKGLPAVTLNNPDYDTDLADLTEYIPWPRDPRDRDPAILYGKRTVAERYQHRKRTYAKGTKWQDVTALEPHVVTHGVNVPAPCNFFTGASTGRDAVLRRIGEYAAWRTSAPALTPDMILKVLGLKDWSSLEAAIAPYLPTGRIDWTAVVETVLGRRRDVVPAKTKKAGDLVRVWEMIRSPEKHKAALGIAFLTLFTVDDAHLLSEHELLPIAEDLYEEHVPNRGSRDRERTARILHKLRLAKRRFDPSLSPSTTSRRLARRADAIQQRITPEMLKEFNLMTGPTRDGTGEAWNKPRSKVSFPLLTHLLDAIAFVREMTGGHVPHIRVNGIMAARGHTMGGTMGRAGFALLAAAGFLTCKDSTYWFDAAAPGTGKARRWDCHVDGRAVEIKAEPKREKRMVAGAKGGAGAAPASCLEIYPFDTGRSGGGFREPAGAVNGCPTGRRSGEVEEIVAALGKKFRPSPN